MFLPYKQHGHLHEAIRRDCGVPPLAEFNCSKYGPAASSFSPVEERENVEHGRSSGPTSVRGVGKSESGPPPANVHDKAKEKKKRSRVTPTQLEHLERFFAMDRNPTATRRKEISQVLSMQERQTQVWFQNRRAKAKLREGKVRSRMTDAQATESSPLSTDEHDANFCHTIFEEMRVTFIPCASLTIGTWKRMASEERRFDLVAYICESRQCLIWFLQSDRWAFKMAIPFNNINYTTFVNDGPGFSILSLHLSKPPQFYLYDCCRDRPCGWKPCSDWTEGYQASRILRHDLLGETMQMADLQQCIFRTKSIVFDHPTQKPIYPYIPTTQNRSHPLIGIPDEEKTVNTAQPTAESHNNNIPRCPSPEAQPYNHQTAIGSVSPVNGIARNTMQRRYLLEVECARSLPGLRPDIQLNGGYFNARS